jgi:Na+-transporting methylmalonyl-CoA/oxaloacetate decarboxylase gamma subunit
MILTTFMESVTMSVFAIVIVFLLLQIVTFAIGLLAKIQTKPTPSLPQPAAPASEKPFSIEDIKDEEMMVAALVASIDYRELTKTNVRVVSIREVKP